jgi:mycothiol synthase
LSDNTPPQLQMVWPEHLRHTPPAVQLPPGYALRVYRPGDEARFYEVMALAGWPGWDAEKLKPWLPRILPGGWFLAIHEASGKMVATTMALCSDAYPGGGELGWLAADPAHAGQGLGRAVAGAVTARFLEAGCWPIHLYTEHYRLPALKTYLRLGYVPYLYTLEMPARWRAICDTLDWPFRLEAWTASLPSGLDQTDDGTRP